MGRPTTCTPELTEQLAELIRKYGFVETVLNYVGMSKQTYYDWLERGEAALDAGDEMSPFASFANAIKKAQAGFHLENLDEIREGKPGWQSKSWLNERSAPDVYGAKIRQEHSGSVATGAAPIAAPGERDERLRAMGITPPGGPH